MAGNGFDLEATLVRMKAKLDGLGQKMSLTERRLEARLELLRVDLLETILQSEAGVVSRARTERDQGIDELRGELDALRHRIEALEQA
jgi:hypothetical protein